MPKAAESFQEKKLQLEIDLLKKQLKEKEDYEKLSKKQKIKAYFINSLPTLLVFVSIVAAIITLLLQADSFLKERKKDNKIYVDKEMFTYLDSIIILIDKSALKNQYLLLLTQYERNAIPVFVYWLTNLEKRQPYTEEQEQDIDEEAPSTKDTEYFVAKQGIQTILRTNEDKRQVFKDLLVTMNATITGEPSSTLSSKSDDFIYLIKLIKELDYDEKDLAIDYLEYWKQYLTEIEKSTSSINITALKDSIVKSRLHIIEQNELSRAKSTKLWLKERFSCLSF
jgi:hypothetical protein